MSAHYGPTRRQVIGWTASALATVVAPVAVHQVSASVGATFNATASTKTDDINKWLATRSSGSKRLTGTAKLTKPLIIPSNTTLDATGAHITGPSNDNILKNAAAFPALAAMGTVAVASTTVTATTAVFTAAMVGRRIQVNGAGSRAARDSAPGALYGTITAFVSSTVVTLDAAATTTTTNTRLFVYPPLDTNITIHGGSWVNQNKNSLSQSTVSHGFFLRRITGISITNVSLGSGAGKQQLGGQYGICIGDCTKVLADQLTLTNTASDGIHIQGPASNVTIQNVTGVNSGDDLVAFTGVDGQSKIGSLLGDCEGDISNVLVQNIHATACRTLLKVTSGVGSNNTQRRVTQFRGTNFTGTASGGSPINVVDYAGRTAFSGSITNVTATTSTNGPTVYVHSGAVDDLVVDGVVWPASMKVPPRLGIVYIGGATVGTATVRNVTNKSVAGKTSDLLGSGVYVASLNVGTLTVSGVSCPVVAPHFDSVQFGAAAMTVKTLSIASDSSLAANGNVLYIPTTSAGYTIANASFSDITRTTGSVFAADADGSQTSTTMSVQRLHGGKAVALLRSPATLTVTDLVQPVGAGAAIRLNSLAASPVRVVADRASRPSALISRTAQQQVSAVSPTIAVDWNMLTPEDGDTILNMALMGGQRLQTYDASTASWIEQ